MTTSVVDHEVIHTHVLRTWQSWQGMGGVDVSPAALVCRVTDVDEEVSETMFWRFILDADR